jgi:hypothetical protein
MNFCEDQPRNNNDLKECSKRRQAVNQRNLARKRLTCVLRENKKAWLNRELPASILDEAHTRLNRLPRNRLEGSAPNAMTTTDATLSVSCSCCSGQVLVMVSRQASNPNVHLQKHRARTLTWAC